MDDILLVGGGLANGLIAARLAERRPQLRIQVLEAGEALGGNHTWSFHGSDVDAANADFLAPFLAASWRGTDVHFPGHSRRLPGDYASISSARLASVLSGRLGECIRTGVRVATVAADHVVLEDGGRLDARAVIDGRGAAPSRHLDLSWQKFVGLELRLEKPHRLTRPIIMDARVTQLDGYRFVYVLPLDPDTLLVEDTYYADGPELSAEAVRARVIAYAAGMGWRGQVVREEEGVLPIALGGDIAAFLDDGPQGVARAGLRAALFHPTTGYSLPDAVALADHVSTLPDLSGPALAAAMRDFAVRRWESRGFFRLLNRMLFRAAEPAHRYRILERFYRLSPGLIARFYAARLTLTDQARILTGRPPVPLWRAMRCLTETRGSPSSA
ncbi:lycopene beta-cyclase CrtY [Xanthobacter pseudotagetidis]|uniref:lycopene beta-cyclase CrtY n=1 Tax=Xanthobacter pseudotagetidis TaxID=3119911 RepID=UPI00372C09B7